jgi:folate-binding protein YgfZ
MYKLRARATIEDQSNAFAVAAVWGSQKAGGQGAPVIEFEDPRLPALGARRLLPPAAVPMTGAGGESASAENYHAHRIALGVPEGDKDYALGDTFPHEANFDQLNGISFTKGCFVGQEVVSRMQNRANVRKRVVPVDGEAPLAPGAEVKAGDVAIGAVGSVAGTRALALLRLDRAAEAKAKGVALTAGGVAIRLRKPDWATFDVAPSAAAEAP